MFQIFLIFTLLVLISAYPAKNQQTNENSENIHQDKDQSHHKKNKLKGSLYCG